LTGHDVDGPDSAICYSLEGPGWLTVDRHGSLRGRPYATGSSAFRLVAADEQGGADTVRFTLVVRSLDEAHDLSKSIPLTFVLKQNYPNPFNPSTTIRFGVPEESAVEVTIYAITGQVVARLLHDQRPAGYYELQWDARRMATGVYMAEVRARSTVNPAKSFTALRKMLLMK
jgi:hypothetical protein